MITRKIILLTAIFVIAVACLYAQDYNASQDADTQAAEEEMRDDAPDLMGPTGATIDKAKFKGVGQGMEVITIGEINILVPKGAKVRKEGSQVIFEDTGEYLGRKFDEIEARFGKIEQEQQEIRNELGQLNKALDEINKRSLVSK